MTALVAITFALGSPPNPLFWDSQPAKDIALAPPPPPREFRFASAQGDGMILQMAPNQANIWGFAPEGAIVTVSFQGKSIATTPSTWINASTWAAKLPAMEGSMTEYNISATCHGSTIALANVMFGDVWVCSGQSNMQYPIGSPTCWNASNTNCAVKDAQCGYGCSENAGEEIAAMANFPHMRLYQNGDRGSPVPLPESANTGWKTPAAMGGSFSAMCWYFGRDLYTELAKNGSTRPIGLIETNVGGTPDQHWSSPDALAKCENLPGNPPWEWPAGYKDSVLWNGKVVPLLRSTIKGAIWMQGEANARADGRQYNCSFQAMIEDWRSKWAAGTDGATAAFPFGWSQLNSNGGSQVWTPGMSQRLQPGQYEDPLGAWDSGFQSIRLAETNTLALENTFQAVIIDTPVASGSVHSPYKQPAGSRLCRGALDVAYGTPQPSPVPGKITATHAGITLEIDGLLGGSVEILGNVTSGFEVLGSDKMWHYCAISATTSGSVVVSPIPDGASAIRYLWYGAPCGNARPYQCPVYAKVTPIGALSGQYDYLPLGPFIREL